MWWRTKPNSTADECELCKDDRHSLYFYCVWCFACTSTVRGGGRFFEHALHSLCSERHQITFFNKLFKNGLAADGYVNENDNEQILREWQAKSWKFWISHSSTSGNVQKFHLTLFLFCKGLSRSGLRSLGASDPSILGVRNFDTHRDALIGFEKAKAK